MRHADQQPASPSRPQALEAVIATHLDKILRSSVFKDADSLRELLRFTVHETIAGRGGDLKEYVLGSVVLRKGDSFDPKADPIVRVQMRRLRERLARYYTMDGRADSLLIEIPKESYTPTFRAASVGASMPQTVGLLDTLLVGRQDELVTLRDGFESAVGGHGLLICLSGEAGIGKTTVVVAFLRELAVSAPRCYIAHGRCSERLAGSEAYLPVLEALDILLRRGDESVGGLMRVTAPGWYAQIARATDPSPDVNPRDGKLASQEHLKRELVALFGELTRQRPLVLFLDDLHWADPSTVDLLAYVGSRCGSLRMLMVTAYRHAGMTRSTHPFARAKLELQAHGICRDIAMPLLTCADVNRYLTLRFPEHLFPSELAAGIHERTEGNPLFMADLVRFLRDRGVFAQREDRWVMVGQLPIFDNQTL